MAATAATLTDEDLRALSAGQRHALARKLAELAGPDSPGPDSPGPDSAGPDSAGPDSAGPDSAGPDSAAGPRPAQRRRVVAVAFLLCLALAAWTLRLGTSLPRRYLVGHWDLAWVGFDLMLCACIAATAVTTWRGSPVRAAMSLATAVMLVCDAWFDVATASAAGDLALSVLLAVLVELPLAVAAAALAYRQALAIRR